MAIIKKLSTSNKHTWIAIIVVMAVTFALLFFMGRNVICTCGYVKLWHGIVNDSGDSQHLFDWYSLTHFLHGLLFYLLIYIFEKISKIKIPFLTKILIAVILASGWEVLENSNYIINRYRAETFSLNYYGDSIINSMGDIVSMSLGFWFAQKQKAWVSVATFIGVELLLLLAIHDNLTLNIIMIIHPVQAIKLWQASL